MKIYYFFLICLLTIFISCIDSNEGDLSFEDQEYALALPLINSRITIGRVAEESKGNTTVRISPDGKATVLYNGDVIRKTAAAIFPPFPGILNSPIPDTLFSLPVPLGDANNIFIIDRIIFRNTKIYFRFENDLPEDISIRMQILNLSKDGKTFDQQYTIPYTGNPVSVLTTPQTSIDGWEMLSTDNKIIFYYEARRPNGEKIRLRNAVMGFDVIIFSYIEGYLGHHVFKVDGNVIDIGLFNNWLSGSFNFEDPKIVIRVDNAFGVPVRSKLNKMELTTITGNSVSLQSPFINTGINFEYPGFSEQGKLKSTFFTFDKNNSNIREVFNEKTKTISYDIDALVNPDRDTSIKGFIDFDSYFNVNVSVEVPLHGFVKDVVITDTLDLNLSELDDVRSVVFKAITSNDFPIDILLQAVFIDEGENVMDVLFENDGLLLPASKLNTNGITDGGIEKIDFISFNSERFTKIKKAKKVVLIGKINSLNSENNQSIWLYEHYGITFKLGGIFDYRKN